MPGRLHHGRRSAGEIRTAHPGRPDPGHLRDGYQHQIKKSDENPTVTLLYETLLKGHVHELLHRNTREAERAEQEQIE